MHILIRDKVRACGANAKQTYLLGWLVDSRLGCGWDAVVDGWIIR